MKKIIVDLGVFVQTVPILFMLFGLPVPNDF
jgi:hypothetical protein